MNQSFLRRLSLLFGRDRFRRELDEEMAFHRAQAERDFLADGLSPKAAHTAAARQFGNPVRIRERSHEVIDFRLETALQDLRFALRTLGRDRSFTIIAVLVLALGIGANVAVFSVVNTLLLRPLPLRDAGRLVWLEPGKKFDPKLLAAAGLGGKTFIVDDFEAFQRNNHSFASVAAFNPFLGNSEYTLTGSGEAQGVAGMMVSGNFFATLGVQPELGREFTREEIQKNGRPVALLSHGFWQRQFHSDPGILGQTILLNKKPVTVVGVMPASFDFGSVFIPGQQFDVFVPAVMDEMRNWGNTLSVVGRLKPDVTVAQAQSESDLVFAGIKVAHPDYDFSPTLSELREYVSGKLRRSMVALWSAVGLVLLIVCVNLSNLLLARTTRRGKEFALRTALGASRGRLLRLLLAESLVLVATGATLGLGLALALTGYLAHQDAIAMPLLHQVRVDGAAMAWTLLLVVAITVLFGMVPALRMATGGADRQLQAALKDGGHGASEGGRRQSLRSALVVLEVALSCVLLVGAGLLLRSFLNTLEVDLGFNTSQAAVMRVIYDQGAAPEKRTSTLQEILRQVAAMPGVQAAGVADMLPLGRNRSWQFWARDHAPRKGDIEVALARIVTPGYLAAMGMHLQQGRDFTWQDGPKRERVVIVNRAAARHFWPGENALGKMSIIFGEDKEPARVVGVIQDVTQTTLETEATPEIYTPVMQETPEGAELVVRTGGPGAPPAGELSRLLLATLRSLNPAQPAYPLEALQTMVDRSTSPRRFFLVLVASFAALGLTLAALGIYGVISYGVEQRTQEIGIRMALGASAGRVQRSILGQTALLVGIGIGAGTVLAFFVAQAIAAMLFGMAATDPATYGAMILLLAAAGLLAGFIPARRASRIDPMTALRGN